MLRQAVAESDDKCRGRGQEQWSLEGHSQKHHERYERQETEQHDGELKGKERIGTDCPEWSEEDLPHEERVCVSKDALRRVEDWRIAPWLRSVEDKKPLLV